MSLSVLAALLVAACTRPAPVRKESVEATNAFAASLTRATLPPTTPPPEAPKPDPNAGACPAGMALVDGEFCPEVEQKCLAWIDPPGTRYRHFRCARYAPSVCKSTERVHMRFCIDVTERVLDAADGRPKNFMSWTSSKTLCEAEGGRLCKESEWVFACEGEEMRPYPYGWERDSAACNVDISHDIGRPGRLVDHRAVAGSHERCASPFGVQDMSGNLEEWVQADGGRKLGWKEVLKGSWWIPSRHACRQFQVGHNDIYSGAETGARCCKDAKP